MKQIRMLTKQGFEAVDWEKELGKALSFEEYVNMELAIIYAQEHQFVESISHSDDLERFVITYKVKSIKQSIV